MTNDETRMTKFNRESPKARKPEKMIDSPLAHDFAFLGFRD